MDLLKKVELLLSAKTRSLLPDRSRQSALDDQEAQVIAEIRQALGEVELKERELAWRLKTEQSEAAAAASRGDIDTQRTHERRAAELTHHLEQESILAINLEEKLAALEEKLALAQEAVDREAQKTARRDADASRDLAADNLAAERKAAKDEVDLETRKSRLSD